MHGMKDKYLMKTTQQIEATSSTKLIDELMEEEKHLLATKTTIQEVQDETEAIKGSNGGNGDGYPASEESSDRNSDGSDRE